MKIQHIICGLLAVAMLIGGAVSASAATHIQHTDSSLIGDVDNSCYININKINIIYIIILKYNDQCAKIKVPNKTKFCNLLLMFLLR